jgi:hypothetical protein
MSTTLSIPVWLEKETFAVQHCPNCPKPYLVRLIPKYKGTLDLKPYAYVKRDQLTEDICGFGTTLAEAADAAKTLRDQQRNPWDKTPRIHHLKTWPVFFQPIRDGSKTFEIRKNDRDFQIGDILILEEFDPLMPKLREEGQNGALGEYTGRRYTAKITYITEFGQPSGQIVMTITPTKLPTAQEA